MNRLMFVVPMFHYKINNFIKKKKLIMELKTEPMSLDHGIFTDYYTRQTNNHNNRKLQEILSEELSLLAAEIENQHLQINNFWFENSCGVQQHAPHAHGSLGYSAIVYLDYIPGLHSPTFFLSNYKNFLNDSDMIFSTDFVQEGDIVFFPSCIVHYTLPSNTDQERQVLSFNLLLPH